MTKNIASLNNLALVDKTIGPLLNFWAKYKPLCSNIWMLYPSSHLVLILEYVNKCISTIISLINEETHLLVLKAWNWAQKYVLPLL